MQSIQAWCIQIYDITIHESLLLLQTEQVEFWVAISCFYLTAIDWFSSDCK